MKSFVATLAQRAELSISCQRALLAAAIPVFFKAESHLLIPDLVQSHLYFIEQGVVMSRCQHQEKEFINWFAMEGDFAASARSFHYQQPAGEYLTACTDVQAVSINKVAYDALLDQYPALNTLARQLTLHYLLQSEYRLQNYVLLTAYERYRHFAEERPDLLQRLPGTLIATYLGMTKYTLSKVRRMYRDRGGGIKSL
jgi:CRP/FNR family transcriptional regulator, anaerobic regulatory protein